MPVFRSLNTIALLISRFIQKMLQVVPAVVVVVPAVVVVLLAVVVVAGYLRVRVLVARDGQRMVTDLDHNCESALHHPDHLVVVVSGL
jgi:hypothetical protein